MMREFAGAEETAAKRSLLFVLFIFGLALTMEFLPWPAWAWSRRIVPFFTDIALVYWVIHHPRAVGYAMALVLGVLMDMAGQLPLGFTAMSYTVMTCLASMLRARFVLFGPVQQALHVFFILCCGQMTLLALGTLESESLSQSWSELNWRYFSPSMSGAVLWLILPALMRRIADMWRRDEDD